MKRMCVDSARVPRAFAAQPMPEEEKIGVCHIKVTARHLGSTGIVGTFFGAEKLLLGWASLCRSELRCEFEILYNDGHKVSGDYLFHPKGGRRPALMHFVRASAVAVSEDANCTCSVQGLTPPHHVFLACYDTADFTA